MTDEQRAAVERLRRVNGTGFHTFDRVYADFEYPHEKFMDDRRDVAALYLAEHPADAVQHREGETQEDRMKCEHCGAESWPDSELPVTEGWLRSVAGMVTPDWHTYEPRLILDMCDSEGFWDMRLWWAIDRRSFEIGQRPIPIATRGDVRRLFALLGIELKPE